jgi:hypothetical protein
MAAWKAQIKAVQGGTPFVVAGSSSTAAETIRKQWDPIWISNLQVMSERDSDWQNGASSSSSSSEATPGMYWFVGCVLLLYLLFIYWYVLLGGLLITAVVIWLWKRQR